MRPGKDNKIGLVLQEWNFLSSHSGKKDSGDLPPTAFLSRESGWWGEISSYFLEVLRSVHCQGFVVDKADFYAVAIFQGTKLLEFFKFL